MLVAPTRHPTFQFGHLRPENDASRCRHLAEGITTPNFAMRQEVGGLVEAGHTTERNGMIVASAAQPKLIPMLVSPPMICLACTSPEKILQVTEATRRELNPDAAELLKPEKLPAMWTSLEVCRGCGFWEPEKKNA